MVVAPFAVAMGGRPEPPDDLDEVEAAEWRAIVDRMPADWFTAEMQPILADLCRHIVLARWFGMELSKVRRQYHDDDGKSGLVGTLLDGVKELTMLHKQQTDCVGRIATRLRLTHQSRNNRDAATRSAKNSASASARPWDRNFANTGRESDPVDRDGSAGPGRKIDWSRV